MGNGHQTFKTLLEIRLHSSTLNHELKIAMSGQFSCDVFGTKGSKKYNFASHITLASFSSHMCTALHMISWTWINRSFIISLEPLKLHTWKVMKSAVCEMTMFEEEAANFSIGFSPLNNSNCREGVYSYRKTGNGNYQMFHPFKRLWWPSKKVFAKIDKLTKKRG